MAGALESAPVVALLSASGSRDQCLKREATMVALLFVYHSTMMLHFCGNPGFLQKLSWLWSSLLPSPQAVSSQSTTVPSSGLLSKPHVPALRLHVHWCTPVSGWGTQICGIDHLCRSHSVPPATDWVVTSCDYEWYSYVGTSLCNFSCAQCL